MRPKLNLQSWLLAGFFALLSVACAGDYSINVTSEKFIERFNRYGAQRKPNVSISWSSINNNGFTGAVGAPISISLSGNTGEYDTLDNIRLVYSGEALSTEETEGGFLNAMSSAIRAINPSKSAVDADRLAQNLYGAAKEEAEGEFNEGKGTAYHNGRYHYRLTYTLSGWNHGYASITAEIY